jgi:hypothetical protein
LLKFSFDLIREKFVREPRANRDEKILPAILANGIKLDPFIGTKGWGHNQHIKRGCGSESEAKMLAKLKGAGIVEPRIWCGGPAKIEPSFAEAAGEKLEVFIVLEATEPIRRAAEACAEKGRYLLPLPGPTMNMLPQALYGDVSWEDALKKTLVAPSVESAFRRSGRRQPVFCRGIVGAPALWAEARESIREGNIVDAVEKGSVAFQNMFEIKVQYLISGEIRGEAEAVALICPLISQEMSDLEQALEAAIIDVESAAEVIGLATAAAFGKWRHNRSILLTKTKRLGVQSGKNIPAILDGERVNLGSNAEIDFVSNAVNVIVPAKDVF